MLKRKSLRKKAGVDPEKENLTEIMKRAEDKREAGLRRKIDTDVREITVELIVGIGNIGEGQGLENPISLINYQRVNV